MNPENPPPYPGPGPTAPYPPYPQQPMGPMGAPPPQGYPYPPPQGYPYQGYPQYGWQGGPQEPPKTTGTNFVDQGLKFTRICLPLPHEFEVRVASSQIPIYKCVCGGRPKKR